MRQLAANESPYASIFAPTVPVISTGRRQVLAGVVGLAASAIGGLGTDVLGGKCLSVSTLEKMKSDVAQGYAAQPLTPASTAAIPAHVD